MQAFLTDHAALISLSILGLMFVGFFLERLPAFSNSAPITIGAMFILAASLRRTGVLDAMAASVLQVADKSAVGALLLLGTIVSVASAFVNNTAVVVILLPIVIELAQRLKISEKKLLIPLSYISIHFRDHTDWSCDVRVGPRHFAWSWLAIVAAIRRRRDAPGARFLLPDRCLCAGGNASGWQTGFGCAGTGKEGHQCHLSVPREPAACRGG